MANDLITNMHIYYSGSNFVFLVYNKNSSPLVVS